MGVLASRELVINMHINVCDFPVCKCVSFYIEKNPSVTDSELRRSFFKICVTQEKFQRYVLDWPCIFLDQKTKQFFF